MGSAESFNQPATLGEFTPEQLVAAGLTPTTDRDELVEADIPLMLNQLRWLLKSIAAGSDHRDQLGPWIERVEQAAARIQADAATIAGMQWQPIETAPDGVMCLFADMKADEARNWAFVDWVVRGRFCGNIRRTATHWMPLPNPPALKGGDHD